MSEQEITQQFENKLKSICISKQIDPEEALDFIERTMDINIIYDFPMKNFYISPGPTPEFPDALIDTLILTDSSLINFYFSKKGQPVFVVFPIKNLSSIQERRVQEFISIKFGFLGGFDSFILEDIVENSEDMRKFYRDVWEVAWG